MWVGRSRPENPRHEKRGYQQSNYNIDEIVQALDPACGHGRNVVRQAFTGSELPNPALAAPIHSATIPLRLFILYEGRGLKLLPAKPSAWWVRVIGTGRSFISAFDLLVLFAGDAQAPVSAHPRENRICRPQELSEKFSPLWRGNVLKALSVRRQFEFFKVR